MTDKSVGREDSRYFGWAIWFWTVFCKQWVWQTFCKNWIWQTFCKTWIWKGLRLNVAFDNYDKWKGWVYLSPCIVLLLVFTGWPIVNTLAMAFQNGYDTMEAISGVQFSWGIDNFTKVISYSGFKTCLFNTIVLCVIDRKSTRLNSSH